jgi:hypothetical protein
LRPPLLLTELKSSLLAALLTPLLAFKPPFLFPLLARIQGPSGATAALSNSTDTVRQAISPRQVCAVKRPFVDDIISQHRLLSPHRRVRWQPDQLSQINRRSPARIAIVQNDRLDWRQPPVRHDPLLPHQMLPFRIRNTPLCVRREGEQGQGSALDPLGRDAPDPLEFCRVFRRGADSMLMKA